MGLRRVLINRHQWHNNALCRAFFSDFPCVASRSLLGKITEKCSSRLLAAIERAVGRLQSDALFRLNRISAAKQQNKAGALTLQVEKTQFIQAVEVLRQNGYPRPKYASVMDVFP